MFGQLIETLLPSRAATVQTLGHPAVGVVGWFDSSSNTSGITITEQTALTFSAVWCADRIISETLATLPCILYRKIGQQDRERATDDPRYYLVHDEPHPSLTPVSYFESSTHHLVMCGNSYSRIVRNQLGEPIRLEPKLPDKIRVEVSGDAILYTDTMTNNPIPQEDMLHVLGISGDGVQGWSVVKYAANSIGGGIAGENRSNSQFKNGAMPGGALIHPMRMTKDSRESLRREWEEIHGGSEKANRIAILHGGMDFKPFSMSNEDAQFLQSRKFSIEEVARWFRVPLHMLAHLENSSVRANIEQQAIEFIVYSMGPWLTRWQQALNRKLLKRAERGPLYFEFLLDALLRGDIASRYSAYSTARQWGWMSVNDIRRAENMNAIDNGDIYLQPVNMVPAGTIPSSLQQDMQSNLEAAIHEIQEQASALKTDLATSHNAIVDVISGRDQIVRSALDSLREDRQEIRQEIANLGKTTQAQGCDLQDLANEMFRLELSGCVKVERSEAIKAARNQRDRGESFLAWLDAQYPDRFGQWLLNRWAGRCERFVKTWCKTSKDELLTASDGDRETFVDRVQSTIDRWDERVKQAVPA